MARGEVNRHGADRGDRHRRRRDRGASRITSSRTTWRAFTAAGIDPAQKRYLMLKSRVHWRAGLRSLAHAVVECAGTGVCTSDYARLGLRRVRRPIYPLDPL